VSDNSKKVSRRIVLLAAGGIVVSTTAAAVIAEGSPGAKLTAAAPRPSRRATPVVSPTETSRPRETARHRTAKTAEPMYYVDDGPKTVALTIDDGPSPVYTPQVLKLLDKYRITASFSMIGRSAATYPAIAREVARAGHLIVNHTWDHSDLAPMTAVAVSDEITRATEAIHQATGDVPRIFRAPYGAWSPTVLDYCASNGLTALDWSVDPRDWSMPGTAEIVDNIMANTRTGSIILEHDGGGNRAETVAALKIVIPRLLDEGYRFRTP
jgi:peptidoglycan/xylan/chitin deacetylase (PgdA/CDA1 family)